MSRIFSLAKDEWRLWKRSRLAVVAILGFAIVLAAACAGTLLAMSKATHERESQQAVAEQTFLDQPARHPHRMVHYGHYAFRAPPPLAIVDPGVDAVTGQSIFLEGHRQNTAMFADARASADLGGLGALTPALVYQILLPLLLIGIGHALIVREREARTLGPLLAQGVTGSELYLGKSLALVGIGAVMLVPLLGLSVFAIASGENLAASLGLFSLYALHTLVWCVAIVLISTLCKTRGTALGVLIALWLASSLIVPRIAVASTAALLPSEGKIETDLRMQADLRELGDGHNASDPAFDQLRANLLAEYDVDRVEDLPVNLRGMVAQQGEADLTRLLNQYADEKMSLERRQSETANAFGWLSPMMAVSAASRAVSGTDTTTHHRFLRETEALRYEFVQGLNKAHAEKMAYSDDINRSSNAEAERRTRISPENWDVLQSFHFTPDGADQRLARGSSGFRQLCLWLVLLSVLGIAAAKRLKP